MGGGSKWNSPCRGKQSKEARMKTLQQVIAEADRQKMAIRHFNISDLGALKGCTRLLGKLTCLSLPQ
jgi:hypothetical protein